MPPKAKEKAKPLQPPPAIEDLFTFLNGHIERSEYSLAVKVADQILAIAPNDADAVQCKVVALIRDDSIEDALLAIQSSYKVPTDLGFFKAYCLYRQNKLNDALQCLKIQESNTTSMLLESQILYRLGKMDACVETYQNLQKSKVESLETNIVASLVSAGRSSEVKGLLDSLKVKATSSFELAYNTACSYIESNNFAEAEQLLLSARRIGQETLMEENWGDDEIEKELAPIAVQLAYVQQLLGRTQEALESYTDIINRKQADESSIAVAINNLIALKPPKETSDSIKKMDRLFQKTNLKLTETLESKLSTNYKKEAIYANRLLLFLQANKISQAREMAGMLLTMFPHSVIPILLHAAVLVRENKPSRAEESLAESQSTHQSDSSYSRTLHLARAQIAASANHPRVACDSLAQIPAIRHCPATVATLMALKERSGDLDSAVDVLNESIAWWSNSMERNDEFVYMMMRKAGSLLASRGREEEAARVFEELAENDGSVGTLSMAAMLVSGYDIEKAEWYERRLRGLCGVERLDGAVLERTSFGCEGKERREREREKEKEKEKEKKRRKRKRKGKLPKGFDPENPGPPPDPERWLPKRERSGYKAAKRRDRRADKGQARGSQGTIGRERVETVGSVGESKGASKVSKKKSRK